MGRIRACGKVFRDPVHQLIRVGAEDSYILDLIDTPEFQRLRRIRQLGVSWLTYHGAEHSRFVHSLGVFNFAQRIIRSLQQRYGSKHNVSKVLAENDRTIKAASLLHDIGHGPFSHMLERAFGKKHHEERTIELILDGHSGINKVLRKHKVDADAVASVIRKDFPLKLVVDIVSSQLDADRMDYLLRDSYCTGVAYGEYDPDWLLHAMCVGRLPQDKNKANQKLCLDRRRGIYAAERFVVSRLHMYQQVYMHRVTRGFEVLVLNLFSAAARCAKLTRGLPPGTPPLVEKYFKNEGEIDHQDFLRFDESQVLSAFHTWAANDASAYSTINRMSKAFLNRERLYAAVDLEGQAGLMMTLGKELETLPKEADGITPIYGVDTVEDTPYKGMLYRAKRHEGAEEIVNESILIVDPDDPDSAGPVEAASKMLKEMDAEQFAVNRLYYDRNRRKDIEKMTNKLGIKLPKPEN
ncbi:MAG TPA: HD domain-containing protein [Tepidisphaeraceae bacterium]|nr:HD domain-containing protein [Tepidisphaeraceae bacterium]